ncbi:MAG: tetratricopeptide repeat-containing glycosyltransferase family 2 protein [Candidatus Scalindua sp.]
MNNTISLCMIVKNEEEFLPRCLNSVANIVDEIIIVDTGSTDRTVEIAKSFGAKVFKHPWEGDFSKARNYSLKYATCDWILILDADCEVDKNDAHKFKEVITDRDVNYIYLQVFDIYPGSNNLGVYDLGLLFRNHLGFHYSGTVHNELKYSGAIKKVDIKIYDYGSHLSEEQMQEKFLRTTTLLKEQLKANPHNPVTHRYLGVSYMGVKMYDEAIAESKIALELLDENKYDIRNFMVSYYIICAAHFKRGDLKEAEKYAKWALEIDDNFIDIFCILSFVYYNLERHDRFLHCSERYLNLWNDVANNTIALNKFGFHTIGHKWKIHLLRGFYFLSGNDPEMGNKEINLSIRESSESEECLSLLGNYYLENKYIDKAEETFRKLLAINRNRTDTMIKMGRIRFQKGDPNEAISFWKNAVTLDPELFDIRLLICKLNISQGSFDEAISECEQLLLTLSIPGNITLECLSDLGNTFTEIGKRLLERQDLQAAETSFNICNDLKELESRV